MEDIHVLVTDKKVAEDDRAQIEKAVPTLLCV